VLFSSPCTDIALILLLFFLDSFISVYKLKFQFNGSLDDFRGYFS